MLALWVFNFLMEKIDISVEMNELIDQYTLAVRSFDDIFYCINGGQFS